MELSLRFATLHAGGHNQCAINTLAPHSRSHYDNGVTTRRLFTASLLASASLPAANPLAKLKIGVTDWNLRLAGNPEAVSLAASLGFEGVEVSLGRRPAENKLPLDNAALQETYLAASARHKIALAGTCLDILHVNYLKSDPLGAKWIADAIPITRRLGARVMLLPFFGKGAIEARAEQDHVAQVLKPLAPLAEKAGILLGLENTISAADNARILDTVASPALKVYYDVGNSAPRGFDVVKEIRWLGRDRICQFHLKDNPHYLGEGAIPFPEVIASIAALNGFSGFANLETVSPSQSIPDDMRRNLAFVRKLTASYVKA